MSNWVQVSLLVILVIALLLLIGLFAYLLWTRYQQIAGDSENARDGALPSDETVFPELSSEDDPEDTSDRSTTDFKRALRIIHAELQKQAQQQRNTRSLMEELIKGTKQLYDTSAIIRRELDNKHEELARYKEGYDTDIKVTALRPACLSHRTLNHTLHNSDLTEQSRAILIDCLSNLNDILTEFGVTFDTPELGTAARELKNIHVLDETEPTTDPRNSGCIACVLNDGYYITNASGDCAILPARVKIYALTNEQGLAGDKATNNTGQGHLD